jgi:hypothetical protein
MTVLARALARSRATRAQHRAERAHLREERALRQIIAAAPTRESAHELSSLLAHR